MASVRKREWTYKGETKTAYVCEYTDGSGKRRRKTFQKKKDADKFRDKVAVEVRDGVHTADSETLTIAKIIPLYMDNLRARARASGYTNKYVHNVHVFCELDIMPKLGSITMSKLSIAHVVEWSRWMLEDRKLSPTTVRDRRSGLKQIEEWAFRQGYTKKLVVAPACKEFPIKMGDPIKMPSKEDVMKILEAAETRPAGWQHRPHALTRLYIHLAAFCGMRCGEIVGLQRSSIDLDGRFINIKASIPHGSKVLKGPKTKAGVRKVPCPPHIIEMLRNWLDEHYVENDRELVLTSARGLPIYSGWTVGHWYPILKRAGLFVEGGKNLHFHSLRHFAGSWWIENGLSIPLVSKMLGHSKPDVTMRVYAHSLETNLERQTAVDAAAEAFLARRRDNSATIGSKTLELQSL